MHIGQCEGGPWVMFEKEDGGEARKTATATAAAAAASPSPFLHVRDQVLSVVFPLTLSFAKLTLEQ